jgi:hypothetical protein
LAAADHHHLSVRLPLVIARLAVSGYGHVELLLIECGVEERVIA